MNGSTPHRGRPVSARFYFDADVLGLAKVVAGIRADVTYPGDPGGEIRKRVRPPCMITDPETADLVWIPLVAREGWSIISRDRRIGAYPAERDAAAITCARRQHRTPTDRGRRGNMPCGADNEVRRE